MKKTMNLLGIILSILFLLPIQTHSLCHSLTLWTEKTIQKIMHSSDPMQESMNFLLNHKMACAALITLTGIALVKSTYFSDKSRPAEQQAFSNFHAWKKACDTIPNTYTSPLTEAAFSKEIDQFCASRDAELAKKAKWITSSQTGEADEKPSFFVEKLEVTPETEIAFHGDLHGDIHSLLAFIEELTKKGYMDPENPFKIKKHNFKIIMLGDYTDRGWHGVEVLFTIMRLKQLNPENFFMVRGNHEDVTINATYGFTTELSRKNFTTITSDGCSKIYALYRKLPAAIYLVSGTPQHKNALICCHGGLEIGFSDVAHLLADARTHCYIPFTHCLRKKNIESLPLAFQSAFQTIKYEIEDSPVCSPQDIGYLWNDFDFEPSTNPAKPVTILGGLRWQLPEQLTKEILKKDSTPSCTIRGIMRAHQHNDATMPRILNCDGKSDEADAGVAKLWLPREQKQPAGKLWDGIVCTFCVSPNTTYGNRYAYNTDFFGILKTAEHFENWNLTMHCMVTKQ